jgi:fumarate hydratase subunit alpha
MRYVDSSTVTDTITRLFEEACVHLPADVLAALERARDNEQSPDGRCVLESILENARIAGRENIPLCQDTGVAIVFIEMGQEVAVTGGNLHDAINEGVRRAYVGGYLRKSIVRQPFSVRKNTSDNTPAEIYTDIVSGDKLRITVMPKGGGAENMTRLAMLLPSDGRQSIIDFVAKTVEDAGSNDCPPIIVGVGIGGTSERTMLLAKKALMRKVGEPNPDAETAALERGILDRVNRLGIGPMGYGGIITALAVHVETWPAHLVAMPVAVNIQCHSARHAEAVL